MKSDCYIVDSSSLITLNRRNPMDVFPSIWEKMAKLAHKERLVAPMEVLEEINQGDDQLLDWAKKCKSMFKKQTEKQIEIVKKILHKYPSLLDESSDYCADPWIVALAIELKDQSRLISIKQIVVTEERLRGDRVRIPFICQKFGIEAVDIVGLFRNEEWKF
ncbi:MAG: DUF4411 family protein [Candidatus Diapherotrites archaeon]|nr:DUF4411 family protein [Candidatus Diapherotrites archaeon]